MIEEFKKDSERQAEFLLTEETERTEQDGYIGIDFAFDKIGLTLNTTINDFSNFMKDRAAEAKQLTL